MDNKNPSLYKSILAQEKWRQKQIEIYYGTGRPLFKNWKEKLQSPVVPNKRLQFIDGIKIKPLTKKIVNNQCTND